MEHGKLVFERIGRLYGAGIEPEVVTILGDRDRKIKSLIGRIAFGRFPSPFPTPDRETLGRC